MMAQPARKAAKLARKIATIASTKRTHGFQRKRRRLNRRRGAELVI
jgi:hypothetical protein